MYTKITILYLLHILYYTLLYCAILYFTVLYYTLLCCTILYCTVLYYTILDYTVIYSTVLYYTLLVESTLTNHFHFQSSFEQLSCLEFRELLQLVHSCSLESLDHRLATLRKQTKKWFRRLIRSAYQVQSAW